MKKSSGLFGFLGRIDIKIYLAILIIIYFVTRLFNLTLLPIFTDESIYIYWAKFISTFHSNWFISLTDGKPPLLIWIIALLLKVLPSDMYLFAGRLPSVFFGAFGLLGIYYLSMILFSSKKVSVLSSLIYILFPFALVYDRMALFDSMLSSMMVWSVYFAIRTAKSGKINDAAFWGIFLGLAFLSKPTAVLFLFLTPVCFFLMLKIKKFSELKRNAVLTGSALLIGEALNNLQRVSSVYFMSELKNKQFQEPIQYILSHPEQISNNLNAIFTWISGYYTVPLLVLGVVSFVIVLGYKMKEGLLLSLLWYVPILAFAVFGRELFPRYILFISPYFIIALAYFIFRIYTIRSNSKWIITPVLLAVIILIIQFDYLIINKPQNAPFPKTDYEQYISYHTSGYGLEPLYTYVDEQSKKGKVIIVTQGTFGLYPYAFNLKYWDNKNVKINPVWPFDFARNPIPEAKDGEKVYIILKEYDTLPSEYEQKLHTLVKSEKPGGRYPIFLTELRND